jgi:hypothetical protein
MWVNAEIDVLTEFDDFLCKTKLSDFSSDLDKEIPFFSKGIYFLKRNCSVERWQIIFDDLKIFLDQQQESIPLSYYK